MIQNNVSVDRSFFMQYHKFQTFTTLYWALDNKYKLLFAGQFKISLSLSLIAPDEIGKSIYPSCDIIQKGG